VWEAATHSCSRVADGWLVLCALQTLPKPVKKRESARALSASGLRDTESDGEALDFHGSHLLHPYVHVPSMRVPEVTAPQWLEGESGQSFSELSVSRLGQPRLPQGARSIRGRSSARSNNGAVSRNGSRTGSGVGGESGCSKRRARWRPHGWLSR